MRGVMDFLKTREMRKKEIQKLDEQIFEAEKTLRQLKARVEESELHLKQKGADFSFEMKKAKQDFDLKMQAEQTAVKNTVALKDMEIAKLREQSREALDKLQEKSKNQRETDAITLKLDYDKQINTLKADHQSDLAKLREELATEYAKKSEDLLKDNYSKLKGALETLHTEGNAQTKFVQDIAKSMIATKFEQKNLEITNKSAAINS